MGLDGVLTRLTIFRFSPALARSIICVRTGLSNPSAAVPMAVTSASIEGHRSSGFLASIRITAPCSSDGQSARSTWNSSGRSWQCLYISATIESASNGVRPVSIS